MKILHNIAVDEVIGARRGFIVRRYHDGRIAVVRLVLSLPVPGRYTVLEDFGMAVVTGAKVEAVLSLTLWDEMPPLRWRDHLLLTVWRRGGQEIRDTKRKARICQAISP